MSRAGKEAKAPPRPSKAELACDVVSSRMTEIHRKLVEHIEAGGEFRLRIEISGDDARVSTIEINDFSRWRPGQPDDDPGCKFCAMTD
jgi:hypothetical protein